MIGAVCMAGGLMAAGGALAQDGGTEDGGADIDVITVKGQALSPADTGFSTTVLGAEDIRRKGIVEINELLEDIPGVNLRDYGLGGVASQTVIRGFGNGTHGGDLGVVIDGIPLNEANSHADGYVDLNVVVPLEIAAFTVYRGPVSALYGNFNRGGLLALTTRAGGDYTELDVSAGSFDTFDVQAALGREVGESQRYNIAGQYYDTDGFRPQSDVTRATVSARAGFDLTDRLDIAVSARSHKTDADSAAYITFDQFERDPYGIDPRTKNDGVDKVFNTLRADIGYTLAPDLKLLTYGYGTWQDFTRWFTRGGATAPAWRQREESYQRTVFGIGTSLNGRDTVVGRPVDFVVGVEAFDESTDFVYFEDVQNRRRVNPAEFDRESTLTSVSAFAEANADLTDAITLSLGVRADRLSGDCTPLGPETGAAPCGDFDAVTNVSPKAALRAEVLPWLTLRTSYSEGFALAQGFAKFAADAQDLGVNELRQLEAGLQLTPMAGLILDLVAYRITSTNEINEILPGEFENFGETLRRGIEVSLDWQPAEQFFIQGVYTAVDSEVEENPNAALIGNQVTGVPEQSGTLTLGYYPVEDLLLSTTVRYVGSYFANAANTLEADDFTVLDLDASYRLPTRTPMRVFIAADNVTDEVYASTIFSIGASPGAPRTLRGGIQIGF